MPKYLQKWIMVVITAIAVMAIGQTVGCEVKAMVLVEAT